MKVALTGVTGNMGQATIDELGKLDFIEKIKLLVLPNDKRIDKILARHKRMANKIEVIKGSLADREVCEKLVEGVDYVVGLAAVIPPLSDQAPQKAVECNQVGIDSLVSAIEAIKENQPKYIHISTVALYGNRNSAHPWARVGDPLLVSPFDIYSATKLRGEFRVLESDIQNFVVLRQSAMLHKNMLNDNMSDGLMFHTCFNAPLEWVTAHDSGVLIANILKRDSQQADLEDKFWKKCFNIGGGIENCVTGYDTLNAGFEIIGGSVKDFFEPNFNATRNFHGVWFYDSKKLDDLFHYQSQSVDYFWKEFAQNHSYFKLGKLIEPEIIKKLAIERLFKNQNSAKYWYNHNDEAKLFAYFGGKDKYEAIPEEWENFGLLIENKDEKGEKIDYNALKTRENAKLIDYYFNIDEEKITIKDCQEVAKAHGGKLLSKKINSIYDKLEWQNCDGEVFEARAYTVLGCGHFYNRIYKENVWDFDRLAKFDKIYASIWYDSHAQNEDKLYYLDENYQARMKNL